MGCQAKGRLNFFAWEVTVDFIPLMVDARLFDWVPKWLGIDVSASDDI